MRLQRAIVTVVTSLLILFSVNAIPVRAAEQTATIKGYVIDSACTFVKNLKKPASPECAVACAKAGSPLVILAESGVIYWPISDAMPATSQNDRLMEFAGKKVSVTGKVYSKGGSRAIVIGKIEAAPAGK
ncbi:MAG TPA: hypothetical protein VGV68_00075 [Terriglobia bacterium]|nr:hypothetical protein [Terriglobia bacterium]